MLFTHALALLLASSGPSAQAEAKDGKDEKICKKEQVTGSLARSRKTCMTRSQWNKLRDSGESEFDRLNTRIQPSNGTPGGGG
jgi:hypothetical protein